jgi:hypothetical protein
VYLIEEERANAFGPIRHWMRIVRRAKCNNSYCGVYRTEDDAIASWDQVDDLHVDSTIRNLLEIYHTTSEAFLKALNEPIIVTSWNRYVLNAIRTQ